MSGPKCDEFALEEHRREIERRKLREELQRKRKEEEQQRKLEKRNREFNASVETEYEALFEELFEKREQHIIAKAIDEAMEEMGYHLIASMTPKDDEEEPISAQIYGFSDGTGIQIMEANGQVSLEVVGLGTNDRIPTEKESEYLEQQMSTFCLAYNDLESKLNKKGIERKSVIYHQKPNKQFSRILNVLNFDQIQEIKTLQQYFMKKDVVNNEPDVLLLQKVQQSSANKQ